jgi:hypothetical protein
MATRARNDEAKGRPAVIRAVHTGSVAGASPVRMIPAGLISLFLHVFIIVGFVGFSLLMGLFARADTSGPSAQNVDEKTEVDEPNNQDLTNPDVGLDPTKELNFEVDRIDSVSVTGPVDMNQNVGISGANAENPINNVPPPPGIGGEFGGGLKSDVAGVAAMFDGVGGKGGIGVHPGFAGRSGATRKKLAQEYGGNGKSEAAVAAGLQWLALHQAPDGHWSLHQFNKFSRTKLDSTSYFDDQSTGQGAERNDVAGTAFGLLPFLAAGQTHKASQEKDSIDYSKTTVAPALKWLMDHEDDKGDFKAGMYAHGLAAITLCEAYGLTSDPVLKPYAQKAIDFIVAAQDPASGGWRYAPRQGGDTSVVGWQVMALKSAQMAGLSVPSSAISGATKWLDGNMSSDKGDYGYIGSPNTNKDSPASAMTAAGLLCRQYLGWGPKHEGLLNGVSRIKHAPPGSTNSMYYYYYATQVMHHMQGSAWDEWNPKMRDMLINTADNGLKKASQKGSWDPKGDAHGGSGGRVMITSLSLLTLEVYYRHLPLYSRGSVTKDATPEP